MASRQSRFSSYTTNGEDLSAAQNAGSTFSHSAWQTSTTGSIWGQPSTRDTTGTSRVATEEMYNLGSSTRSSALPPSTDTAGPWGAGARTNNWTSSDNLALRSASGSTSPTRTRDAAVPRSDYSSSTPFYGNSRSRIASQAGNANARAKPLVDATSNNFQKNLLADEKENASPFNNSGFGAYGREKRGSQGSDFVEDNHSREQSMPRAGRAEVETYQSSAASYGGFNFAGPESSHIERPSLSSTASFPSSRPRFSEDEMANSLQKALTFHDTSERGISRGQNQMSHGQTFQLNASTPSWQADNRSASRDYNGSLYQIQQQSYPSMPASHRGHPSSVPGLGRTTNALSRSGDVLNPVHDPWPQSSPLDSSFPVDAPLMGQPNQPATYPQQYVPVYSANMYSSYLPAQYRNANQLPPAAAHLQAALHANLGPAYGAAFRPNQRARDPAKSTSPVLEDFKKNAKSNKRFELKDIYGHVVAFCGDQTGSRFVQNKLETANSDEKEQLFHEISPNAVQLMQDVFGNYVIQKFFEHGTQKQKHDWAQKMKGRMASLSLNTYSCRVVQKALDHILVDQQAELVEELRPDIRRLIDDQHANHVVQKIVQLLPRKHIDFVVDVFRGDLLQRCRQQFACRIVQRILERGTELDKESFMRELHPVARHLIDDQYGNYVVQHIIQNGGAENRDKLVAIVKKDLLKFSKNKHASNVVESCIVSCSMAERCEFASEFMRSADIMKCVIKDQYANYVIQKLAKNLEGTAGQDFDDFVKAVVINIKRESGRNNGGQALQKFTDAMWPGEKNLELSSTALASPTSLQIDTAAPTPGLTREPNTPLSSGPPSTDASAAEETVVDVKSASGIGSTAPQFQTNGN